MNDYTSQLFSYGEVVYPLRRDAMVPVRQLALSALGGSLGGVVSTLLIGRAINVYGYVPIFTVLSALPIVAFAMISLGRLMQARENNV
jgi:hypothetical protein